MKKLKLKKIRNKTKKRIVIAEAAILVVALSASLSVFAANHKQPDYPEEDTLSAESLELKEAMDAAKADEDEAKAVLGEVKSEISKVDRKLKFRGVRAGELREEAAEYKKVLSEEKEKFKTAKAEMNKDTSKALDKYKNCGKYFLNSKASTSVEYWTAKARANGATSAAANSALFSSALNDALSYDHLMLASQQIDKSNSLGGVNRQIDYNLMTAAAVGVAVYASNHGLVHTYSRRVIGPNYGPWEDENLAYGMDAARAWVVWYDNEAADNGPHFRNIRSTGRTTTGYGYTSMGSPAPSHAQEFGVKGSGAVLTSTSQFRADLKAYREKAKEEYEATIGNRIISKMEPPGLVQARINYNTVIAKLTAAGDKIDVDYKALLESLWKAQKNYDKKHEIYLAAKKAFEESIK